MRTHRGKAALAALALGALTLAGCSGGADTSPSSADETLTIARWAGPHADTSIELIKEFTKETGINVRVDAIDYAQLKQKQTLNLQSKTGDYDLVYVPAAWYQEYIDAGYLEPLNDFLDDPELAGADYDFTDFIPASTDITSKDGNVYGLPDIMQTDLLVYDTDALATAGLDVPKTWDEALAVAAYFKEEGTGIALPARQGDAIVDVFSTLAKGNDAALFDADGALDLTNPKVVEAAQFIQDLTAQSVDGSTGWHYDEVAKAMQFGQAPIGITISGLFSALEDPAQSQVAGKLGYAPLPYNDSVSGYLATSSYSVAADSKHKEDAFKLAAWLTSKETEKKMIQAYPGHLSARASVFDDESLAADAPWMPAVKETLANATTVPLQANAAALIDALGVGLNGMVVNGTAPDAVMQDVQSQLATQFK